MSSTALGSLTFCSGVYKIVSLTVNFLPNVLKRIINHVCAKLHNFVGCGTSKMYLLLIKFDPDDLLLSFRDFEYNTLAGDRIE
jgi:hypothetical protein